MLYLLNTFVPTTLRVISSIAPFGFFLWEIEAREEETKANRETTFYFLNIAKNIDTSLFWKVCSNLSEVTIFRATKKYRYYIRYYILVFYISGSSSNKKIIDIILL